MPIFPLGIVGPWEIVIIALIVLLLFGGKKIPELMKGLGKGVKSFKDGLNEVEKDIKDVDATLNDKGNNTGAEKAKNCKENMNVEKVVLYRIDQTFEF